MCVREKKTTRSSCINMYFVEYCAVSLETLITLKYKLDVREAFKNVLADFVR